MDAGADVNAKDSDDDPLLYTAVRGRKPGIVQILLDAGADVNAKDSDDNPLLYTAIDWGYSDIARLLVDAGADVNAKGRWGTSLVEIAFEENEPEIVRILVEAGAEVDFPPSVPRIAVIDRSDNSLTIRVYGSIGIETYYAVRRRDATPAGEWVDHEVRDTDGSFEDRGLNANSTYYYALQACNAAGCSELSSETVGMTESSGQVDAPVAPLLRAETSVVSALFIWNTYIDLSWDAVDGATYYEIYRGDDLVSSFSAPRTTWSSSDHLASYRVKACNKAGCSPFSNTN